MFLVINQNAIIQRYIKILKDIFRKPFYLTYDFLNHSDKSTLIKNQQLKLKYAGKRAFLLLTGASLDSINLTKLKNEFTLGVGFIFLHKDIRNINLDFYFDVEPFSTFHENMGNWPEDIIRSINQSKVNLFYNNIFSILSQNTSFIFGLPNKRFISLNYPHITNEIYYIRPYNGLHNEKKYKKNYPDLTRSLNSGGGCIYTAILVLIYMGFSEIFLCGAGYTYTPSFELHFYDNYTFKSLHEKEYIITQAKKVIDRHNKKLDDNLEYYDLNKSGDSYRGVFVRHLKIDDLQYEKHRVINNIAISNDVKIYNIVPKGFESPVYEKVSWDEVKKILKK